MTNKDENILDIIVDSQRGRQCLMISAVGGLFFIARMCDTSFGALLFGWIGVLCFIAFMVTQFTALDILEVWRDLNSNYQPSPVKKKKKKKKTKK